MAFELAIPQPTYQLLSAAAIEHSVSLPQFVENVLVWFAEQDEIRTPDEREGHLRLALTHEQEASLSAALPSYGRHPRAGALVVALSHRLGGRISEAMGAGLQDWANYIRGDLPPGFGCPSCGKARHQGHNARVMVRWQEGG